mmetsp:Transcript_19286/g.44117  ORF Transcript_19286/g.44117 Transcript_19286/m.44117 type:complete len:625 (+) Transcript_19286:291-2165(+)
MEVALLPGAKEAPCGVGEAAVVVESRDRTRGRSPTKKERGYVSPETIRVKAKPARRKSLSERVSGALRMTPSDLVASFASGSTEVMSSFGMGCEIGGGPDSSDSTPNEVNVMSPVDAARLVSAEFFAEQQGAAIAAEFFAEQQGAAVDGTSDEGNGTSDEGSGRRSPVAANEIYVHPLPSLIDESCDKPSQGPVVPSTPETPATAEGTPETPGMYETPGNYGSFSPYPDQFETVGDDESVALEVGMSAESYLEECFVAEVSVLDREKFNTVPQLSRRDFTITRHLGKGSFSDVFEVSADIPSSLKPKTAIHKARSRRASLATSVAPAVVGKKQEMLAMKCLRPQIRSNCDQFVIGAEDLVHETAMLASLDHPFIIKLHARASGSLRDSFVLNDGYFILLDRLTGTLTDRLQEWKSVPERLMGPGRDELNVALSVADAVTYLHSKRIVFRDLKPDNVGFDSNGTLKLFDFGFAVGLPEKNEDNPSGLLTDRSGTPRYMAPEVGMNSNTLKIGYGRPVDVYSFGVLFWQLCSKQRPFECIQTADEFESRVYMGDYRPDIDNRWPAPVQNIIKFCWQQRPKRRPAMKDVKAALDAVLTKQPAQQAHAVEDVRPRVKRDKRLTMSSVS